MFPFLEKGSAGPWQVVWPLGADRSLVRDAEEALILGWGLGVCALDAQEVGGRAGAWACWKFGSRGQMRVQDETPVLR